jgi:branched-chain amino acid transport system permease protein
MNTTTPIKNKADGTTRAYGYLRIVPLILALAIFVVLGFVPTMTQGYAVTLLTDMLRYVILAVAWMLFSGPTGYMSLATAAFYGLGFYMAAVFSGRISFPVIILVAGVIGFVVALGVGALTLRLRGVYFAIFTFALVLLVQNVVLEVERVVTHTRGRFVAIVSPSTTYYAMFVVVALTIFVSMLIRRSRYGLALQSIGEYEEAAAHSGINVVQTKVITFGVSAIFMGMAGAIVATQRTYIDPYIAFDLNQSFLPVVMAMFGGMGNLVGPVIGGALFTEIQEQLQTRFPNLFLLIVGMVLILAITFMPNGVLGLGQQTWRWIKQTWSAKRPRRDTEGGRHAPA